MKNKLILFWMIVAIVIASIVIICTKPTKLGLDLVGGSRLVWKHRQVIQLHKLRRI